MDRALVGEAASRAGRAVIDLLYPPRCVGCARFGVGFLCDSCVAGLTRPEGPDYCQRCSAPWDGDLCLDCVHWDSLTGCRAVAMHAGAARQAVHALKYGHVRAVAKPMAEEMMRVAAPLAPDVAFAVPLHRSRVRRRGYNQAEALLANMKLELPQESPGRLVRARKTRTQVGLDAGERRANVVGAFGYRGEPLDGRNVLLVDDVVTSGATANECARVLKEHGAVRVHVAAFARANPRSAAADS